MFVVHRNVPDQAGPVEDLKSALAGLQVSTRTEDGCLSYEWSESIETPGTFYSIETWESRDALEKHLATDRVKAAVAALPGWLGGQPALVGYEAAEEITLPL